MVIVVLFKIVKCRKLFLELLREDLIKKVSINKWMIVVYIDVDEF